MQQQQLRASVRLLGTLRSGSVRLRVPAPTSLHTPLTNFRAQQLFFSDKPQETTRDKDKDKDKDEEKDKDKDKDKDAAAVNEASKSEIPEPAGLSKSSKNGEKDSRDETSQTVRAPISWKGLLGVIIIGTGIVLFQRYSRDKKRQSMKEVAVAGKALLGGPFDLEDTDGKRVTSEDFKGKYVLLYFGFTHCPDICPAEIHKMQKSLADLKLLKGMPKITPIFITIDPARDTKERLKQYAKSWNPDFVWLTGPLEKIDAAAKAYRVYYSIPTEDEKMGDPDYLVDHSIFFYLLNPEGEFMEFFGKNLTAEEVTFKMARALRQDIMAH